MTHCHNVHVHNVSAGVAVGILKTSQCTNFMVDSLVELHWCVSWPTRLTTVDFDFQTLGCFEMEAPDVRTLNGVSTILQLPRHDI